MTIENYIQLNNFLKIKLKRSLSIKLQYFTDTENQEIETKLNILINECGCQNGSYFFAIGILGYAVMLFYFSFSLLENIFLIVGVILFSIMGKLISITMARIKLKSEIIKIIKIAQQRDIESNRWYSI